MIGDCSRCGHSVAYHAPLVGCWKCQCGEFRIAPCISLARRVGMGIMLAAMMAIVALLAGCPPQPMTPRRAVRGSVLIVAIATEDAIHACDARSVELSKTDAAASDRLWKECSAAYAVARPSLVSLALAVDGWSEAEKGRILCLADKAIRAFGALTTAAKTAGASVSPAMVDGMAAAADLAAMTEGLTCPTP